MAADELTFTPEEGDAPAAIPLKRYVAGPPDVNMIEKRHNGYPVKRLKVGKLRGRDWYFEGWLRAATKADLDDLLEEWQQLLTQVGQVDWSLVDSSGPSPITNADFRGIEIIEEEVPAIAEISQQAEYTVALRFLEGG